MSSPACLTLRVLPHRFAVVRLNPDSVIPKPSGPSDFWSVTRTRTELSLVCRESEAPAGARVEADWIGLEVEGPLEFSQLGILASLTTPLAEAGVSVFALSTFDTDYLFIKNEMNQTACRALSAAGHRVVAD